MTRGLALVAVWMWAGIGQLAAQSVPAAVFHTVDAGSTNPAPQPFPVLSKGVTDRRIVGMHLDRLFESGTAGLLLNVDAHRWVAVVERFDRDVAGHRAWVGAIAGIEHSHVSFVERNGVVSGLINSLSEIYVVSTLAPGTYALDRVSDRSGGELEPRVPAAADYAAGATAGNTVSDDAGVIDVLMLYTPGARVALGGVDQMQARVAQIISDSNTIFARSGITTRLRLVAASEAALPETTNMSADLDALTRNPSVQSARNTLGADLVQLLQDSPSSSACGIGWLLQSVGSGATFPAYSIADISAGCVYTPTHEMGHNMGSHHAPEDQASGALFPHSYGYKDPQRGFRTVMAYACPTFCPRVPHMSNPGVLYNGGVTGTAAQNNALSINQAAATVANFRQSVTVVTPPAAPTGLQSQVNGQSVTISWNAVATDAEWAAAAATGYSIQVGTAPGVYNVLPNLFVGNTTAASGSAAPGTYYWRVIASNSAGSGPPSAEAQFTLGGCTPPGPPQNFSHVVGAGRAVTLVWAAPSTGSAPFTYTIDVGSSAGRSNLLSAPIGNATALTVTAPSGTYYVRVRAANACAATGPVSVERLIVVP
jgi:hypothetical protein